MNIEELKKPSDKFCYCGNCISKGRVSIKGRHIEDMIDALLEVQKCKEEYGSLLSKKAKGKVQQALKIVDAETSQNFNKIQQRKGSIVGSGMRGQTKTR